MSGRDGNKDCYSRDFQTCSLLIVSSITRTICVESDACVPAIIPADVEFTVWHSVHLISLI